MSHCSINIITVDGDIDGSSLMQITCLYVSVAYMADEDYPTHEPHKHGNRLSDIILGGQDGLVSILGLLLGLSAATNTTRVIIAGGLATIIAETLSMGAVAYTSMMADRDHYSAERKREHQANQSVVVPLSNSYTSTKGVKIYIYFPRANTKTSSPLPVVGTVPGSWSFEASFPIRLEENNGKIIAQTNAHVLGNWMSTNLVIFSAQLTFPNQPSGDGKLIIEKDNPSGLTQNSDYVSIPIRF